MAKMFVYQHFFKSELKNNLVLKKLLVNMAWINPLKFILLNCPISASKRNVK